MTTDLPDRARELALPYYADALPAHDRFHAERVRNLSERLAASLDQPVDTAVLTAAAWLHDIGRPRERTGDVDNHDAWAADEAARLLAAEGVDSDRVEAVEHCIRAHSMRFSSPDPETVEARLLFDADKLETTGARGIVRLACIVGERSGRTGERYAVIDDSSESVVGAAERPDITLFRQWMRERLDKLWTVPGERLGESRWQFMEEFLTQFEREQGVDGDR